MAGPTVGVVLQSASPLVANSMSAAGFDWLVVDPIHSPLSQLESLAMQTAVGDANPTPVLMRVGGPSDRSGIQQATDTGAAGVLVPNVRTAADIAQARRPTRFPPVGDRSLFGPVRAHHKAGMTPHMLQADKEFVLAVQLEKAPAESWDRLLALDFHVAVLDMPQLCVEMGLYDALLAAPPAGDGTLASRLEPWLRVYGKPPAEVAKLVTHFAALCRRHGKVAGALLGDHRAAGRYHGFGMRFIGIGSDLMVMTERGVGSAATQRDNRSHGWKPAPLNCDDEKQRSDSFWESLGRRSPLLGGLLADDSYEATRAVRASPLVLLDCFREGLNTPAKLGRALRSLDGSGHRLVRIASADAKDTPMTAAVALALGADSVVVPVSNADEARAVKAACSYDGTRALNIGPELPFHVAKTPAAGIELLGVPASGLSEVIASADFVMASTANFSLAAPRAQALGSLAALQQACAQEGKAFILLDDAPQESTPEPTRAGLGVFAQRIAPATQDALGEDEQIAARNARIADLKLALRSGTLSLGQVVCAASPAVAAAYVACGVDWIWIEWQHSCQDAVALRAQVAAVAQRGGLSIARTAGAHDKTGIQQSLDAGVDFVLIPYINSVAEAREAIRHCLFAPRGDRVWNASPLSRTHNTSVMFQCETSACVDALEEILHEPELEFCFVGPGDLAMSMGLRTRDSISKFMAADELKWCFRYAFETTTRAGRIPGAFTRDGDPSKLLAEGFAMVALSADLVDAMTGAQAILTGDALKQLEGWSRRPSKLIPTLRYRLSSNLPALLAHLWEVKGWRASPTLVLPNAMPAKVGEMPPRSPPTVDAPLLSVEQVATFRRDGFLTVARIAPADEVARLRELFRRLFDGNVGWESGAQYDLVGTDSNDQPPGVSQLLNPLQFAPELATTRFRANALAIAVQILGDGTVPWFEHAILKPPRHGAATPWHQDEAHRDDPGTAYEQLSIWMPLQDVAPEHGCMRYIPGSHHGDVLAHRSPNDDPRISALECVGPFDPASAAVCPLPAGDAVMHHCRTLHSSGPNRSDVPRYAYVLAFRGPVRPNPAFTGYAWNAEKRTAAQARARAWENRGGVLARAARSVTSTFRTLGGRLKGRVG
jgi:2-keto-3-deoxy-L-rhamnonate aldolase RhmA/ectoine hydroxylase-related dioxygenase (phytanoyl-CoA dioxygenase family)